MYLIFDTETTGLPKNYNAPLSDSANWPRLVQLAWQVHDLEGNLVEVKNFIIKPENFTIPYDVVKVHGITTERALQQGVDLNWLLLEFEKSISKCHALVGHNISFDLNILGAEYYRKQIANPLIEKRTIDTKELSTDFCAIPGGKGGKYKWPRLEELHFKLFNTGFDAAHNAAADVEATTRCFLELMRIGIIDWSILKISPETYDRFLTNNPKTIQAIGLNTQAYNPNDIIEAPIESKEELLPEKENPKIEPTELETNEIHKFTHLHLHTQYSILDGMTNIKTLIKKVKDDGMNAVAITDHGNMYGVKEFHEICLKNGIKPIIGMEAYMASRSYLDKDKEDSKSYHLVLIAKNQQGYKNLMKLTSIAFADGFYYHPRIDKNLLRQYREGIIATSACLGGEIAQKLTSSTVEEAEKSLLEYKAIFGDDFYFELQRHKATDPSMNTEVIRDQTYVNKILIELADKHQVKYIATNDVHFLNEEDAAAHDRLICLSTGKDIDDPRRMKYTGQEWCKTQEEMIALFGDLPLAIANTQELANKIEEYPLNQTAIMPDFEIPEEFENQDAYLKQVTYEGAYKRWGENLLPSTIERIEFELFTIKNMGFPGYFLIVWDFLKAARQMGVSVGPGRGSAAGSVVAYCLRITEIDPLKYGLLFERFLNPERVSMPDIDIDFDDEGRDKVLEWVKNKYGAKRVAHLITFGTMAAKSSIKDVARVQRLPLNEAIRLTKMVPDKPGTSLADAYSTIDELKNELSNGSPERKSVLDFAKRLEGSVRNTGTHACGIIISRDDLDNYCPTTTVKDSVLDYATQYDGHFVESIGLLKMDFLGLKTLTIIKDAVRNIKLSKKIELEIDKIDLEDKETFELYGRGETSGLFQFESEGMKKHLRNLKPSRFEDLIAMNALYRPGPMEYIDLYINRKNGIEKIQYDLPAMETVLSETYGITVYQEQVMLLSRELAGFSLAKSDILRKAMGKKQKDTMDKLKQEFINGCSTNGHPVDKVEKIWKDWEAFANYAFNKSHATCYSYVSYQTAYLKAHYPAEFMAAVLSHELKDIKKLNFYLNEANRMGTKVLGPNVNQSYSTFTVNNQGEIRYGMAGIKGVGEAAVESIVDERNARGLFSDIFDFIKRINLRSVNKKAIEALAYAGAFDEIQKDVHRAQFFFQFSENDTFIERLIKYGNKIQSNENSSQVSLFGDTTDMAILNPEFPICEPWSTVKKLNFEKEMIGFFLSGHPLDVYQTTFDFYVNNSIKSVNEAISNNAKQLVRFAGVVTAAQHREAASNGNKFGFFNVEDKSDTIEFPLFKENYLKYSHLLQVDNFVFIQGNIGERFKDNSKTELIVNDIILLDSVLNNFTKQIIIQIPLAEITKEFTQNLQKTITENPGKASLQIFVNDGKRNIELAVKKGRVAADAFLLSIKEFPFIQFRLTKI